MEEREVVEIGDLVLVEDIDGTEVEAEIIDIFELNDVEYYVLADYNELMDSEEEVTIFFLKWDEDAYLCVSDELEFKRVKNYFNEICGEWEV